MNQCIAMVGAVCSLEDTNKSVTVCVGTNYCSTIPLFTGAVMILHFQTMVFFAVMRAWVFAIVFRPSCRPCRDVSVVSTSIERACCMKAGV